MIHARQDYNNRIQDSANIIPAAEPVFLLRGQDKLAPQILREYARLLEIEIIDATGDLTPEDGILLDTITDHATAMEAWQKNNIAKIADMPENVSIYNI